LRDPQQSLPFTIEDTTGWIKTKTPLDREVAGSYRFLVEAQDGGEPSLSALATVQVNKFSHFSPIKNFISKFILI